MDKNTDTTAQPNNSPDTQVNSDLLQSSISPTNETVANVQSSNDAPLQPTQVPSSKKQKHPAAIAVFIILGVLILLGAGIGGGMLLQNNLSRNGATVSLNPATDGNTAVTQEESSIAAVAEKINPSVVSIVGKTQTNYYYSSSEGSSSGTGIIVSKDGYVLTNNHVVENTTDLSIVDSEGNKYTDVTLVGRDPLNDVAFLKIKANVEFKPAELGNSTTLRTGQQVVAIGNALGQYSNSVTSGIISGTGRPITAATSDGSTENLTDLIQTDASINPGNSGGPLVNMAGQVIGINTAIIENANGIGFAIPINATKGILAGVLEKGTVSRAYLGVNYVTITPDIAEQYELTIKQGAYVFASGDANPVEANSPADKAGLQKGDIITKIGDVALGQSGGLPSITGQYRPGDTVQVTYVRGSETKTTDVTFTAYNQ